MKIKFLTIAFLALTIANFAQDRTIVNANNSEVSDNLDLRAVASLFGDSQNLDDFERRLNDPKLMISNLDLNNDNQVDYLRVIESVEDRTHLIVIQSVFQVLSFANINDFVLLIIEPVNTWKFRYLLRAVTRRFSHVTTSSLEPCD